MNAIDPLDLARRLIACPSVTPADAGAMAVIAGALESIGFAVHRFAAGEAPDGPVENLFAIRGQGGPHFAFAGHSDVVPPGEGWSGDPFVPEIRGDLLYGRGAVDMKGAIAAFIAAAARLEDHPGTISLIITGDEEGPATFGTVALIDWMKDSGICPDLCLVGEPTSTHRLGDMVKIGRRGSVNMWIENVGTQGHVAYPHLAANPIPALVSALDALAALHLDDGNDWFQPSNLEITTVDVGNGATNLIPATARARLNIRFNDAHRGADLVELVRRTVADHAPDATVRAVISGESFITPPGDFSALISAAIVKVTGLTPELSTSGGTSDARFLSKLCPVVEFGLCNATMHKLDEAVAIPDLYALADIYEEIARTALAR
ncbi:MULTISPECIES: succinyl-diaminopimelate desuccinylase [unclassified Sphingomonas]|uniref:succinyl-diaminopimelate desuccinylase n=1 Tax=unclassified Sphingomonas TaxID=196159 RepID=UPI0007007087|nr:MULTISPECIES: succinyl-diaminopimelate desuccinylase [unclassified Sphingomonas]KQX17581.1 succinyl-diaminopimelate desuccinylase [Sphingomonas sp. Root1294]KQY70508.1 succinyl-diaminopimelate desuccinylase [Sphingomonas sp. Root50]KRB92006.1 succinyl-diaminopimelate desuccinylase [Sphingomonas sp. Root720]